MKSKNLLDHQSSNDQKNSIQVAKDLADSGEGQRLLRFRKGVKQALIISGIAAAAGFAGHQGSIYQPPKKLASDTSLDARESESGVLQVDKIGQVDQIISKAEINMENLRIAFAEKTEKIPHTKELELLGQCFILMAVNQANPNKNALRRNASHRGGSPIILQTDINYFSYALKDAGNYDSVASFAPRSRTMFLPLSLDEKNLLDSLVIFHELQHVMADTAVRFKLKSEAEFDAYNASFIVHPGDKQRILIISEGSSFSYEIEMLNILLNGKLKREEAIDLDSVKTALNAREDQKVTITLVLELAKSYYQSGSSFSSGMKIGYLEKVASKFDALTSEIVW